MATNLYRTPDPRGSADYHASWCGCTACASDWELAHRRPPLLTGLLLAIAVAGLIALAAQVLG